MQTLLDI